MKPYHREPIEIGPRTAHAVIRSDGNVLGVIDSRSTADRIVDELNVLKTRIDEIASLVKGI